MVVVLLMGFCVAECISRFFLALDDNLNGDNADMAFGVLAAVHGYEVVAIAFDKVFGAVFARLEGFHNVHIAPAGGSVLCAGSVPISMRWLKRSALAAQVIPAGG